MSYSRGPDFSFSFSLPSPQGAAYQKVYTVKHRGKCLDRMEKICADWKGRFVSGVSISYGVASTEEFSDLDSFLKAADLRMYEYKNNYYQSAGKERRKR